jgi:hypothetical protein
MMQPIHTYHIDIRSDRSGMDGFFKDNFKQKLWSKSPLPPMGGSGGTFLNFKK